ncbi:ABC transporter ATP-binding protein [Desulfobacula toluolica]|uniref:Predicted O-antigen export system ATP-binding protein n=1 Tax=Desulfobacula toluolica (strain DSM 7467 / Tol2) TaxID=651182 RepID=K0NNG6_DESTT|nr:ABC transporter ATP-binding protein [Desulfobacula toluolica]CCK80307.1 predicted O-antigen export system ATP-binding protein [Desulfobacula toluolica Tol2]
MNKSPLISVNNISKKYCKDLKRSLWYGINDIAKEIVGYKKTENKLRAGEFWSLRDISFELSRGECIGLIGRNGAGKSTLLKILNGLIKPDSGYIQIKGRVGALIELGAGFNPLLTGRENIYINGSVLGFKQKEIERKLDEIIEFAELNDFIDSPVQNYSSGMKVRLGFAIASQMNPDIMLIDEVLAVGDFQFRQKCAQKINEIKKQSSIILVSHNMRDLMMLCDNSIVIESGHVVFAGETKHAVSYYHNSPTSLKNIGEQPPVNIFGKLINKNEKIIDIQHYWCDKANQQVEFIDHNTILYLNFSFKLLKPVNNLIIGVPIWDENANLITAFNTDNIVGTISIPKDGILKGRLRIPDMMFNPGRFKSIFVVMDNKEYLYRNFIHDFTVKNIPFSFGFVTPKHDWIFE